MPLTEQPVYYPSVPENSPAGTKVIQLNATDDDKDPDQKISYRLISGNPEGFFSINTTTGKRLCLAFTSACTSPHCLLPPHHKIIPLRRINKFCVVPKCVIIYNAGLITTTSRRLDRENQPEHILEVRWWWWEINYMVATPLIIEIAHKHETKSKLNRFSFVFNY